MDETVGELLGDKHYKLCGKKGSIELLEGAPEGGKRQSGEAFLNGRRLKKGDKVF